MIKKYGVGLFLLLLLAHCACIYFGPAQARAGTKLLLIPFLLVYVSASREGIVHPLAVAGLVFSFAGDWLLIYNGDVFFLTGMLAFMCAHICYTVFFIRLRRAVVQPAREKLPQTLMYVTSVITLLAGAGILVVLGGALGAFTAPVIAYMIVIWLMATAAASTAGNPVIASSGAPVAFTIGALAFVASDGLLALNKFMLHDPGYDIPVMLLYGLAQLSLTRGFVRTTRLKLTNTIKQ